MIRRFLFAFVGFFLLWGSMVSAVSAQEEAANAFENSIRSVYTVQENGNTLVEHTFSIKNLTPTYYITKHGLRTSSTRITGIRVFDSKGNLDAEITQTQNQTNIGITFPDKLVGEGKIRQFTISYTNPDLAQINGSVLEVAIPKQADPTQYAHAEVILNTPLRFGTATRVTPSTNFSHSLTNEGIRMTFPDLGSGGVSALFGLEQIFDLKFTYFLENNDSQPVLLQTALPPDTSFQRMNYTLIDPLPKEMKVDEDGNWIATFYMPGNTAQTVQVVAQALITLEKNPLIPVPPPQVFHTLKQPFWETDNPSLQELAAQHATPKAIYDFVTSQLTYGKIDSLDDLKRKGAVKALEIPDEVACQEFSDLFVTMGRINSIPTRVATGYAYTQNSQLRPLSLDGDILHAWPEYWDGEKQYWQPVDPTWGNTTGGVDYFHQFDLNHIVFALNGKSSTLPYPAGSYTRPGNTEKTLDVSFGKIFPEQKPALSATIESQKQSVISMPGFHTLQLTNTTGAAWYHVTFDLHSEKSGVRVFGDTSIPALLPFQSLSIPLFVYNTQGTLPEKDTLRLTVFMDGTPILDQEFDVTNAPNFVQTIAHPYALLALGICTIILALGAGSVLILRRKR